MTEEQTLYCANHPNRETMLRCSKCEKPICVKCAVQTPVGLRCRECAHLKTIPTYDVSTRYVALALLAGLGAGVIGGVLVFLFAGGFALWLSPVFGYVVGEAVSRAANRKRGPRLQLVTFVSVVTGAILGKYGPFLFTAFLGFGVLGPAWAAVAQSLGRDIWLMLFTAIALFVGLGRVR